MTPETALTRKRMSRDAMYNHVSHRPGHGSILHMALMLIDGIGLGMIAVCTIFEGYEDYIEDLVGCYKENPETIFFFLCGLMLASLGLLFLIFHCASFESAHEFEHIGNYLWLSQQSIYFN